MKVFPPMNYERSNLAVVSDDHYVIAVGGGDEMSVELFNISSNTWSTVTCLPRPLRWITATLSRNILYAMNDLGQVYSIPMSYWTNNTSSKLSRPQPTLHSIVPVNESTLSTISGEVVVVGGKRGNDYCSDIHQLCLKKWVTIGCMDIPRYKPMVAILPGDRMVVVGGGPSKFSYTSVELAVLC